MFYFEGPYTDMLFKSKLFRPCTRPTVIHQETCPRCNRKRVNIYYSANLDKYMCKKCMDKLLGEKGGVE